MPWSSSSSAAGGGYLLIKILMIGIFTSIQLAVLATVTVHNYLLILSLKANFDQGDLTFF